MCSLRVWWNWKEQNQCSCVPNKNLPPCSQNIDLAKGRMDTEKNHSCLGLKEGQISILLFQNEISQKFNSLSCGIVCIILLFPHNL